jgi:hypothetical protein
MAKALMLNCRPLKWSFDALKEYDPDRVKKALRRMMGFFVRQPRLYFLLWRGNAEKIREAKAKRERMCVLLGILARKNPAMAFLLWKRLANKAKVDELDQALDKTKKAKDLVEAGT